MDWLQQSGYTHCFFVAGGNAMHLIESASYKFKMIPFIHEVGAGIAADFFNETCEESHRAFVIVTAGPGLTNIITAISGAWLDRRELLVLGGQAKSTDLNRGRTRQVGFQEIGGVSLCETITKASILIDEQISKNDFLRYVELSKIPPKGPVFLEICLDISTQETQIDKETVNYQLKEQKKVSEQEFSFVLNELIQANRPLIVLGGGIHRTRDKEAVDSLTRNSIPIATTLNGSDRVGSEYEYHCGRPNWYGSRWANLIIQQSDLVIYIGESVGILAAGYNWQEFLPLGKLIQIDLDERELGKGFPSSAINIAADPSDFITRLSVELANSNLKFGKEWLDLIKLIRKDLSGVESSNISTEEFIEYYSFIFELVTKSAESDLISPCSSGQTFESLGRVIPNKQGQKIVINPGLASMGYGLSGAIGMSLANLNRRTISLEGDGGFAQNLQELGVVKGNNLNIKIFIGSDQGYGSIKIHQKTAFNGHYLGCDRETGLWLPDWKHIAEAFKIKSFTVTTRNKFNDEFMLLFNSEEPVVFIVEIDPHQAFYPKISSTRNNQGLITSNPIHLMDPPLDEQNYRKYAPHLSIQP